MGIFSENPKSFTMNRKSETASILKSSISSKLPNFLSDYSDDVLAEYITVLVCNGKHQYQARDDLEAFLGERTTEFVSWVWGFLLNHAYQSNPDITLSDPKSLTEDESNQCMKIFDNKVVANLKSNVLLPNELLQPKREPLASHLQSSLSEHVSLRNISATNVSRMSHSRPLVGLVSHQNERSRGSVWDRLGKPVNASGVGLVKQEEQLLTRNTSMLPVLNSEHSRSMIRDVPGLGNRFGINNNVVESRKLKHGVGPVGTMCKSHAVTPVSNIGRKRHFGEVSSALGVAAVSLVGERNVDLQCKEIKQESKKSNLITKDSKTMTPNLVSEVLDVKQRLHQIEMEMSKLRSRQVEMEKDGKHNLLSNSRSLKLPVEDNDSKTVLVTNVHFAATKEALSSYFTKCGVVVNVVILTDKATAQPKGSAYVTFASKESVDKALELSGTTFFSRTVKVLRKAESAAATSGPAQLAWKPCQAPLPHINRNFTRNKLYSSSSHLQWRRESISARSEPSAPASVEEK